MSMFFFTFVAGNLNHQSFLLSVFKICEIMSFLNSVNALLTDCD